MECLEDIFGQNDANATKMAKYTYMLYEISTLDHIFDDSEQF